MTWAHIPLSNVFINWLLMLMFGLYQYQNVIINVDNISLSHRDAAIKKPCKVRITIQGHSLDRENLIIYIQSSYLWMV